MLPTNLWPEEDTSPGLMDGPALKARLKSRGDLSRSQPGTLCSNSEKGINSLDFCLLAKLLAKLLSYCAETTGGGKTCVGIVMYHDKKKKRMEASDDH